MLCYLCRKCEENCKCKLEAYLRELVGKNAALELENRRLAAAVASLQMAPDPEGKQEITIGGRRFAPGMEVDQDDDGFTFYGNYGLKIGAPGDLSGIKMSGGAGGGGSSCQHGQEIGAPGDLSGIKMSGGAGGGGSSCQHGQVDITSASQPITLKEAAPPMKFREFL